MRKLERMILGILLVGLLMGATGDAVFNSINVNGNITLNNTVWDDLRFPVSQLGVAGSGIPGLEQIKTDGGGSTGVYVRCFDTGSEEYLVGVAQLPHGYKAGTDLEAHVHWAPSTADAGNVTWGLEYILTSMEEAMGATTTLATATVATDSTAYKHHYDDLVSITGTTLAESDMLIFRIYRDVDNGDDYGADACLLELDFHYQADKLGSDNETP